MKSVHHFENETTSSVPLSESSAVDYNYFFSNLQRSFSNSFHHNCYDSYPIVANEVNDCAEDIMPNLYSNYQEHFVPPLTQKSYRLLLNKEQYHSDWTHYWNQNLTVSPEIEYNECSVNDAISPSFETAVRHEETMAEVAGEINFSSDDSRGNYVLYKFFNFF